MFVFLQIGILLVLLGVNVYLSSFTLFDPIYTLIAHIIIILYSLFFILFLIKPNMLKFKNYILAFTIILITLFNVGYGGYVAYISISDNEPTIKEEIEICAKDLTQQWNLLNGKQELYYKFYFCDKSKVGSPIVTTTKFKKTEENKLHLFNEFDMVSIEYYEASGYVLNMENEEKTLHNDSKKPYYLLILLISPILMTIFNQKNIEKIQKKKLTADEEYALFLLGKDIPQDEPETFMENVKSEWNKMFNRSKNNTPDDDDDVIDDN